ncbi:MAG: Wzt carbohydrate-binding domain-containing protein [Candidatus Nanopelagicales bacterium]
MTAVEFRDPAGESLPRLLSGAAATARICYSAREQVDRVAFGLQIRNSDDVTVMAVHSGADGLMKVNAGDRYVEWVMDPLLLAPGQYNLRTEVSIDGHVLDVDEKGQDFVVREGGSHQGGLFVQPGFWRASGGVVTVSTGSGSVAVDPGGLHDRGSDSAAPQRIAVKNPRR